MQERGKMSEETMNNTAVNHEYGADQIQILEGLEAVRKRPGMYIGTTSSRGLHHLVYEIVDNSVDEALAGFCDTIDVTINEDNSITVIDNGRGIPIGINRKAGIPAVEVVFTILHAGGKFGGGGYKVSGGLHGVGASVVNALSDWLEVEICQDGKVYKQRYERGHVAYSLKEIGTCPKEKTGTKVSFLPDRTIFTETTVFDFDILRSRLREMAFLTKNLRIILRDSRVEEEQVLTDKDVENAQISQLLERAAHFPAGVHSGLFERRAPLTDEDRLMIFLLADTVEIDGIDAVLLFYKLVDDNRRAVRNLLFVSQENFFPHDLRDHKLFALIGKNIFRIQFFAFGKKF